MLKMLKIRSFMVYCWVVQKFLSHGKMRAFMLISDVDLD